MNEPAPPPERNRLPGQLVVWALIIQYAGILLYVLSTLASHGHIGTPVGPFWWISLLLIALAILVQLTQPNEPPP